MSAYLNTFVGALRAAISACCPEVDPDGIWEGEHAAMVPWTKLTPPYAAIVFDLDESEEWTADGLVYEFACEVWYVAPITGDSSLLRPRLEAIRDWLFVNDAGPGQVLSIKSVNWGRGLEPNREFEKEAQQRRAGRVVAQIVMGEFQP